MTLLVIPVGRNTPLFSTTSLFVTKNGAMCCSHGGKWGQSCICDIIPQCTSGNCTPGRATGRADSSHLVVTSADSDFTHQLVLTASLTLRLLIGSYSL